MKKEAKTTKSDVVSTLVTAVSLGFCFGFAMEKGGVFIPRIIVLQMLLQDFTMVKMFLTAACNNIVIVRLISQRSV
jgi:hypothetical protein